MKILIITDIHANYQALTSVVQRFDDADEVWCLGDIVEIGPRPADCIDLVRSTCKHVIKGNHDASFVAFDPPSAAEGWNGWEYDQVSAEQLDYLTHLPIRLTASCDDAAYLLVHGSPQDPLTGRLDDVSDDDTCREAVAHCRDGILCGHTHVAMIAQVHQKWIVNAGSVGQPRDGDNRAQCMVLEDGVFSYHLVSYDLDAMEEDYRDSTLPVHVQEEWIRNTREGIVKRHGLRKGPLSHS